MIYITGDTHGDFRRIARFCQRVNPYKSDIMIILGDAGINYFCDENERLKKAKLADLPITLFCIHGNHECRPSAISSYKECPWHGGMAYIEEEFPSLIFAKDGEIYDLDGFDVLTIGGAYSVDKAYRLARGHKWWPDEQPSDEIKQYVEQQLAKHEWMVDTVLSHTIPLRYEPREAFLSGIDQSRVDTSTEEWLERIENKLMYRHWYAGHYHVNKRIDDVTLLFDDIELFMQSDFS